MFDVQTSNGVTYNMMFQRKTRENGQRATSCIISEVVDFAKHGPERYDRVIESVVVLNPKDRDCKAVGFKYALTRALATKEFRDELVNSKHFWDKFLEVWGKKL